MSIRAMVKKLVTPGVKKFFFHRAGFNKMGLYHDDLYCETPEVEEAVRRLPQDVYDARVFRITRAHQLALTHTLLPENEWTKFEEDQANRYLEPYLEEVNKEKHERETWWKMV